MPTHLQRATYSEPPHLFINFRKKLSVYRNSVMIRALRQSGSFKDAAGGAWGRLLCGLHMGFHPCFHLKFRILLPWRRAFKAPRACLRSECIEFPFMRNDPAGIRIAISAQLQF